MSVHVCVPLSLSLSLSRYKYTITTVVFHYGKTGWILWMCVSLPWAASSCWYWHDVTWHNDTDTDSAAVNYRSETKHMMRRSLRPWAQEGFNSTYWLHWYIKLYLSCLCVCVCLSLFLSLSLSRYKYTITTVVFYYGKTGWILWMCVSLRWAASSSWYWHDVTWHNDTDTDIGAVNYRSETKHMMRRSLRHWAQEGFNSTYWLHWYIKLCLSCLCMCVCLSLFLSLSLSRYKYTITTVVFHYGKTGWILWMCVSLPWAASSCWYWHDVTWHNDADTDSAAVNYRSETKHMMRRSLRP